jgi:hypothetical protein
LSRGLQGGMPNIEFFTLLFAVLSGNFVCVQTDPLHDPSKAALKCKNPLSKRVFAIHPCLTAQQLLALELADALNVMTGRLYRQHITLTI